MKEQVFFLKDTEEHGQKSPNGLEKEILNEITQQELFSQDLMNRIDNLETDIFLKFLPFSARF